ncbi:hypothetical protein GCM10009606_34490 [Nocardioides aquiterrae]|uniref:Uncharacterized protein n=1 Tax=Nocardioides aquiterrae TaxID=203799 RepID=A0ABN1UJ08_9ACTN
MSSIRVEALSSGPMDHTDASVTASAAARICAVAADTRCRGVAIAVMGLLKHPPPTVEVLRTPLSTGFWASSRKSEGKISAGFGWWFRGSLRSHLNHRARATGEPGACRNHALTVSVRCLSVATLTDREVLTVDRSASAVRGLDRLDHRQSRIPPGVRTFVPASRENTFLA